MNTIRRLVVPQHVVSRQVGDTVVVLDLQQDKYFGLPKVGARIWELLSQGCDVSQIVEKVALEYDVSAPVASADTHALIEQLIDERLLLRVSD